MARTHESMKERAGVETGAWGLGRGRRKLKLPVDIVVVNQSSSID